MREHKTNPYYSGPITDHFDGRCFFLPSHNTRRSADDFKKWRKERSPAKWPNWVDIESQRPPPERVAGDDLSVTFIGHATVLIQTAGRNILTDPFFSKRASPTQLAGPKRVHAPGIALKDLPPIDLVLVSHNHYDHLDLRALGKLHDAHKPHVITPLGNGSIIRRTRRPVNITEADWGDTIEVGDGVRITVTPALHWSQRSLWDRNMCLWGAFIIEAPGGPVYFAADTGYGSGDTFRNIRSAFGPPRLALIPIGAYEPRWFMAPQHMNPDEAVRAHKDLEARHSCGIHHGTVQLTDEARDQPVIDLAKALDAHDVAQHRFRALAPGESWSVP